MNGGAKSIDHNFTHLCITKLTCNHLYYYQSESMKFVYFIIYSKS